MQSLSPPPSIREDSEEIKDYLASEARALLDPPEPTKRCSYIGTSVKVLFALTGSSGLILSSIKLNDVFTEFIHECASVLNSYSHELAECRSPFEPTMRRWELLLVGSCYALGFLAQLYLELTPAERGALSEASHTIEHRSNIHQKYVKLKQLVGYLQTSYGYETSIGLGYLFNGLWGKTNDIPSWEFYYNCQAASIGIGGFLLGMFSRIQLYNLKQSYSLLRPKKKIFHFKSDWAMYTLCVCSTIIYTSSFYWGKNTEPDYINFFLYANIFFISKPLGVIISRVVESRKQKCPAKLKDKAIACISSALSIQSPVVVVGYFAFLRTVAQISTPNRSVLQNNPIYLPSIALIGIAMGIKDAMFKPYDYELDESRRAHKTRGLVKKVTKFAKDYFMTTAMLGSSLAFFLTRTLKCESVKMYVCPFSFELSGNYVNLDGKGLGIVFSTALATFYLRKTFKVLALSKYSIIKNTGFSALNMMDKYQFDLISAIPLSIFVSGEYIQTYSAFASYNPYIVLCLLGYTLGVYKEQIKSRTGTLAVPGFTNVGVMLNPW